MAPSGERTTIIRIPPKIKELAVRFMKAILIACGLGIQGYSDQRTTAAKTSRFRDFLWGLDVTPSMPKYEHYQDTHSECVDTCRKKDGAG